MAFDLFLPLTPRYTQLSAKGGVSADGSDGDLFLQYAVVATILFTAVVFLFESYLSLRQRSTYYKTNFPAELSKTVGNIDAERAKEKKDNGDEVAKEESEKKEEGDDDKKSKVDRNAPILPQLQEKFSAAQSYGLDKVNFSLFSSTYSVLEGIIFLLLGVSLLGWCNFCA